jgi:hypothetical protein
MIARATARNSSVTARPRVQLHGPESNLDLWFNSDINHLETAMLIEQHIIGGKGFQIAREGLLISPLQNRRTL